MVSVSEENKEKFRKIMEIFSRRPNYWDMPGQVYVPSNYSWPLWALEMTKASTRDILYDLGSGDGRVLAIAKYFFNVKKAKGIENNPRLVEVSRQNISEMRRCGIENNGIEIIQDNYLNPDISDATLVYCYKDSYFDSHKDTIVKKLERELQKKTRISIIGIEPPLLGYSSLEMSKVKFVRTPLVMGIYTYRLK